MNAKLKRIGKWGFLPVFLLLITFVFISCPIPIANFGSLGTPPAGKGYLTINLGDSLERTILPGTQASDLLSFSLVFTPTGTTPGLGADETVQFTRAQHTSNPVIVLPAGNWDLVATAFATATYTSPIATYTHGTNINIAGGSTGNDVTLVFVMFDPVTATGTGTFSFAVDLSNIDNLGSSTLSVSPSIPTTSSFTLTDTNNQLSRNDVVAGYYTVTLSLQRTFGNTTDAAGTHVARIDQTHSLHVYQGAVSHFALTGLTNDSFIPVPYDVTYNLNDSTLPGTAGTPPAAARVNPNATVFRFPTDGVNNFNLPTHAGYTFQGWYTGTVVAPGGVPGSGGTWGDTNTPQFLSTTPIIANTTVWARWDAVPTGPTGTITIQFTAPLADMDAPTYSTAIVYGSNNRTLVVNPNIPGTSDTRTFTGYQWLLGSTPLGETSNTLTIDTTQAPFNVDPPTYYEITVLATEAVTNAVYSAIVRVQVVAP